MVRLCLTCNNPIVVGKSIISSPSYSGLKEVIIHVECLRCRCIRKKMSHKLEEEWLQFVSEETKRQKIII